MENKTMKELKAIAKELHVSNWWNLKKDDLIKAIEEKQALTPEEQAKEAEQKAREQAAMKIYDADWKRFGKRYNPVEFIEKFRSGKIILTDDELKVAEKQDHEEKPKEQPIEESNVEKTPATTEKLTPKRGELLEYNGKSQNICAWGKELNISPNTLYGRIYKMGWSIEKAFTTPARKK